MTTKTFATDIECSAEYFWDNIKSEIAHCPAARFGAWLASRSDKPLVLDADESAVVEAWLAELPGWSDAEYPTYAPHPLTVQ